MDTESVALASTAAATPRSRLTSTPHGKKPLAAAGEGAVARALAAEWEARLRRLLAADTAAVPELARVVTTLAGALERTTGNAGTRPENITITQRASARSLDSTRSAPVGLRADFYARATAYPVLRSAMQGRQVREWIGEDRVSNLVRQGLEEAAASWDRAGRDPSGLFGGVRLAAAQGWAAGSAAGELTRVARDFVTASDRRRRRGVRRRNAIIAVLAALALALGGFAATGDRRHNPRPARARCTASRSARTTRCWPSAGSTTRCGCGMCGPRSNPS